MMAYLEDGKMYCDGFMCKDHDKCQRAPSQIKLEDRSIDELVKIVMKLREDARNELELKLSTVDELKIIEIDREFFKCKSHAEAQKSHNLYKTIQKLTSSIKTMGKAL